jgi:hypothetical protein
MSEQQNGVSPASAGGASLPDNVRRRIRVAAEDLANTIGCTVVDAATQRGVSTSDQLRPVADKLHSLLGEEPCVMATVRHRHLAALVEKLHVEQAVAQPDPRNAEIERLRTDKEKAEAALAVERQNLLNEMDEHRTAQSLLTEAREEWKRADAEVTRLKRLVGNENVEPNWKTVDRREAIRQAVRFHTDLQAVMQQRDAVVRQLGKAEDEVAEVAAERDRLRAELDGIRPRVRELANALGISTSEPGAFEQWIAEQDRSSEPEPICGAGNEDYPELRCKRVAGHEQHEDPSHGATWSPEIATAAKPRRWYAHSPEPEVGTVVGLPDRKPNGPTWTRHPAGGWQRSNSPGYRMAWKSLFGDCGELVEVVSTDG